MFDKGHQEDVEDEGENNQPRVGREKRHHECEEKHGALDRPATVPGDTEDDHADAKHDGDCGGDFDNHAVTLSPAR